MTKQKYSQAKQQYLEECDQELTARKKKQKNQTKNIPKNFGKAIINFVFKNNYCRQAVLEEQKVDQQAFLQELDRRKNKISTIQGLRLLWTSMSSEAHTRCMRILSSLFLRKYGLEYIFNSRIKETQVHIKYLRKLQQAIKNPQQFRNIKDY